MKVVSGGATKSVPAMCCLGRVKVRCVLSGCGEAGGAWQQMDGCMCHCQDCLVGRCAGCRPFLGRLLGPVAPASFARGAGDAYAWHFPLGAF